MMRPRSIYALLADPTLPPQLREALHAARNGRREEIRSDAAHRAAALVALRYRLRWREAAALVGLPAEQPEVNMVEASA
ncbi:MAG: hypothetical protein QM767_02815 [Anaeromyxobacter sp.]